MIGIVIVPIFVLPATLIYASYLLSSAIYNIIFGKRIPERTVIVGFKKRRFIC